MKLLLLLVIFFKLVVVFQVLKKIIPKTDIPQFKKLRKYILEKFCSTDARGLVSIQALPTLNIYFGEKTEISKEVMSEFLYDMSYGALNKKKWQT